MRFRFVVTLSLLLMTGAAALAADGKIRHSVKTSMGTSDEQAACTGDATRFCNDKIPDTFAVLGCLQSHRKRISKACRHVLEANGQ